MCSRPGPLLVALLCGAACGPVAPVGSATEAGPPSDDTVAPPDGVTTSGRPTTMVGTDTTGGTTTDGATGTLDDTGPTGGSAFAEPVILEIEDPAGHDQIQIPAGALGFDIAVFDDAAPGVPFGVQTLVSPAAEPVMTAFVPIGGTAATGLGYDGVATAAVPQGDAAGTLPTLAGSWGVEFRVNSPSARAVVQVQRTDDGAFHGGMLDLHVYIADGLMISNPGELHGVSAATAEDDEDLALRLAAFDDALTAFFDIAVGEVAFHPLAAPYLDIIGTDELNEAITSTGDGGQALTLLLVDRLEPFPGTPVWGISPGAPGVPLVPSTRASAMALALGDHHDPAADALTLAHEFGHFVGLQHTTAIDGAYADPLSDTPRCAGIGPATLSDCPDANNLMFPAYYQTTGGVDVVVSTLQRRVVEGSPVYRAYAR